MTFRHDSDETGVSAEVVWLDALPQAVVAYQRDLDDGEVIDTHSHGRAQFLYASAGVMTITSKDQAFVVPPQRAVWMPGGCPHRVEARSVVAMRTLYVRPDVGRDLLPESPCVLHVTPLLRELIVAAADGPQDYAASSPQGRLMDVILDQLTTLPVSPLSLPVPDEPRLAPIVTALLDDPSDPRRLSDWAITVGTSERTLSRLFPASTGMSFRAWRQQCCLLRALEWLARGDSVTRVAVELGYDSTSAFIAMFKRALGTTPTAYFEH